VPKRAIVLPWDKAHKQPRQLGLLIGTHHLSATPDSGEAFALT